MGSEYRWRNGLVKQMDERDRRVVRMKMCEIRDKHKQAIGTGERHDVVLLA